MSRRAIVGWMFVGTALPEIALMTLGAAVFSFVGTGDARGTGVDPFGAFLDQHALPGWFVVVFMVFVVVQLFGINSLDLYSSGVTLQAMGLRIRRYHAVLLDSAICLGITVYAVFNSQFSTLLKDFVAIVIVWIAPWCGIFLADWLLREAATTPSGSRTRPPSSPYWSARGVSLAGDRRPGPRGRRRARRLEHVVPPELGEPDHRTPHGAPRQLADLSIFLGSRVGARRLPAPRGGDGPPPGAPPFHAAEPSRRAARSRPVGKRSEQRERRRARERAASSPSASRHSVPSVTMAPTATGSRPTRRSSRSAAATDAPVETTSSISATRRPSTTGTRRRSSSSRWSTAVVIERTGSATASSRWIFGVLCRITYWSRPSRRVTSMATGIPMVATEATTSTPSPPRRSTSSEPAARRTRRRGRR